MSLLTRFASWWIPWAIDHSEEVAALTRRAIEQRAMRRAMEFGKAHRIEASEALGKALDKGEST